MDSKKLSPTATKLQASIARQAFIRAVFLAAAISAVSLMHSLPNMDLSWLSPKTYADCVVTKSQQKWGPQNASTVTPGSYLFQSRVLNTFWGSFETLSECEKEANVTKGAVREVVGKGLARVGDRSLCVGVGVGVRAMEEMGFLNVTVTVTVSGALNSLLHYQDCSFDFVFSKDVDKVSAPALLVLEVERILKPGGVGALLLGPTDPSNTKVSSLLRSSTIVHVGHVIDHSLVVFKKRLENRTPSFFKHHHHQRVCASVRLITKPLIELMEPLVEETTPPIQEEHETRMSYLPEFVDMSNRKRLVYVDVGVREENVTDYLFLPSNYPIDHKDFSVYFVHYNSSILLSHVRRPGITFVYHPELSSRKVAAATEVEVEEFDFLAWFKEIVQNADFVVLKMHAGEAEMKLLEDMFESGAICFVDEMFLSCSQSKEMCMDIYKNLRRNGVYVHQWWETELRQGS